MITLLRGGRETNDKPAVVFLTVGSGGVCLSLEGRPFTFLIRRGCEETVCQGEVSEGAPAGAFGEAQEGEILCGN